MSQIPIHEPTDATAKPSRPRRPWLPPLSERRWGPFVGRWIDPRSPPADLEIPIALVGTAGLLAFALLPLEQFQPFVGACNFKSLTGLPCMSCGMTRAFVALSQGSLWTAFRLNPLFMLPLFVLFAYTPFAWWMWLRKRPRPRIGMTSARARWALAAAIVLLAFANWAFVIFDGR